jgi:hypothetical protein
MDITENTGINFTVYDTLGNNGVCAQVVNNFDTISPTVTSINVAT